MSRLLELLTKHSSEDEFLTTLEMHEFIDLLVAHHQNHPTPPPCDLSNPSALEAVAIVNAINDLTADEASFISILTYSEGDGFAVTVSDSWTKHRDEQFLGSSLFDALNTAIAERNRRIAIMSGRQNADSTQS